MSLVTAPPRHHASRQAPPSTAGASPRAVSAPAARAPARDAAPQALTTRSASSDSIHLKISGLTKRYGQFTALSEIDLAIREGEFVCFLGPSGCGKTTLLRAIAGLAPQSEGTIHQRGQDISRLPPQARDFGIVFQSYALFPNLTVFDNVAYGLRNRRDARDAMRRRVTELLTLVDLAGSEGKYPAALSGGQQQRVALARALATEPGLLLLDEPLSALDARVRLHLRSQIKALQARLGVTTIMVTHDQEEALAMADRIVVMNHGVIEQIGTPAEIYRQPASAFVAEFIGSMNFLQCCPENASTLRLGQQRLECAAHDLEGLDQARLAIRPEAVSLCAVGEGLSAQVDHVEFLGAFLRITLTLEGCGQTLSADVALKDSESLGVRVGARVGVRLPSEAIRLYPLVEAQA
ncbi:MULTISPECIES: putative 2-aminoethylphosphonate ABC transporter ATP-binding protein [unclassified Cobetia]|uniref:putative 2-aminoethylphosphonate ABC transporter ATP-binding protein n=1 Tax=unclassified Cobetia TaxID=2609414 RepID=UPI00178C864E|nr:MULTISPECIES: putative 2-aminoethylphosphonate ABC transporter ATP-binding protein [unclassified Cobetia]MBE2167860.1 putative 2-aminoethylphosphonate ABC transporter ATP-binding protein [Cobetia sp. 2AS1]MDH2446284.1 putative 2-aminoethylphosphonate ABC transporter ATP-binding protein [Cobetia sp. 2AS]